MLKSLHYLVFFILFSVCSFSQVKIIKPVTVKPVKLNPNSTNLGFGFGLSRSVLYLSRNIKEDNDALGYHFSMIYGGKKLIRTSLEYTLYRAINIEPTWYNVKASTLELNMHVIAHFKETEAYFYPLFGLSYNIFSGYYTGENDFLNLGKVYQKNQSVSTKWLGVNVGTGYEYYFKPGSFFIDYKMRIGITEGNKQLNIMDVCFTAGLRFNVRVPSIYRLFRGTRSRYLLDTKD